MGEIIEKYSESLISLPMIPLRGMTIMPNMIAHFDVTRAKSAKAIETALEENQKIFIITQRRFEDEELNIEDLYQVGVVADIKQIIKLPMNVMRVLVDTSQRAKLIDVFEENESYSCVIEIIKEKDEDIDEIHNEVMLKVLKELLSEYVKDNLNISKEAYKKIVDVKKINVLLKQCSIFLPFDYEKKQILLESINDLELYDHLTNILKNEIEINKIKRELQEKIKLAIDKNQKEYILREQLKLIREELGGEDPESEIDSFLEEVKKLKADKTVKDKLKKEINRFKNSSGSSSENNVIRGYIETLLEMPWDKESKDNIDIKKAENKLNQDHYGLYKVKERILEFLAVRIFAKDKGASPILCLVGPPGTGKTSIAKSIAEAIGKKYIRISLGGVRDEAEIRGHRKTYVGAMPGRIANGLKAAGVKNPLMLFDEIDKLGNDYKGDPASALLEVLDSEQNIKFVDHYIEIPIDLSKVLFVATANSVSTIPRALLDRMEIIEITSYTLNEKEHIAKEHLIEKQKQLHGLAKEQLIIPDKIITKIIENYTKESGVRTLERTIGKICRKATREIYETKKKVVRLNDKKLIEYLGNEKFVVDLANEKDEIGIVRGLAWTSVGGVTLQIEVNIMPGKGEVQLTGKLGEVMKESAKAGLSYIRSIAGEYDIKEDFFRKHDIHIHIPEGAVPKDGPSAGISMSTAMLSAITNKKVRSDIAMTGEITLRGRVLQIGGLKEKILAAKSAGVKCVILPEKNRKDIEEIENEIKKNIKIEFVNSMKEVIDIAFVKE